LPRGHPARDADDVPSAAFTCAVCAAEAGTLELRGAPAQAEVVRESFTSTLTQPVSTEALEPLRAALAAADAGALFALDPELAPFYCAACGASYCGAHWDRWDVFDADWPDWHESIRGRCPQGHERLLED
jgi:hypothetical protein